MLTLSRRPISLLVGTEDRDQEIVPSAAGQNWDFGRETSALAPPESRDVAESAAPSPDPAEVAEPAEEKALVRFPGWPVIAV